MPNYLIDLYLEELPRLQAEQRRWMCLTSLYGAAEATDYRKEIDDYLDKFLPDADPGGEQHAEALREAGITSPEEHAAMLASMGVSMVIEDGKPRKPQDQT